MFVRFGVPAEGAAVIQGKTLYVVLAETITIAQTLFKSACLTSANLPLAKRSNIAEPKGSLPTLNSQSKLLNPT